MGGRPLFLGPATGATPTADLEFMVGFEVFLLTAVQEAFAAWVLLSVSESLSLQPSAETFGSATFLDDAAAVTVTFEVNRDVLGFA